MSDKHIRPSQYDETYDPLSLVRLLRRYGEIQALNNDYMSQLHFLAVKAADQIEYCQEAIHKRKRQLYGTQDENERLRAEVESLKKIPRYIGKHGGREDSRCVGCDCTEEHQLHDPYCPVAKYQAQKTPE